MRILLALMVVSVGVAGLGLMGCQVSVRDPHDDTVYVEQEPEYVIVREAPPPIIVEHRPAAPSHLHIWIDGFWNWNNRYVWEPGHWTVPPQQHAVWVAPRYDRHDQGYRYAPGHWKADKQDKKQGGGNGQGRDKH